MVGFFAVQDDQFPGRRLAADLLLNSLEDLVDFGAIDPLEQAAESRLAGRRIVSLGIAPDAQSAALGLGEAAGKFGQVLLSAWGSAQHGQQNQSQQGPQRIGFNSVTILGDVFEVIGQGADFGHPLGTAGNGAVFDERQVGLRCSACRLRRAFLHTSRAKSRLGRSCLT